MRQNHTTIKRITFFLLGITILTFGTALTVIASFGTSFWSALFVGLEQKFGLTFGTWYILIQVVVAIINAFLLKKAPEVLSIITIVIEGLLSDIWLEIIFNNITFINYPPYIQISIFIMGLVLVGFGVAVYVIPDYPQVPMDKIVFALSERCKFSISKSQFIIALIVSAFAFILGGPIGIGTLIAIIIFGKIVENSYEIMFKFYNKI